MSFLRFPLTSPKKTKAPLKRSKPVKKLPKKIKVSLKPKLPTEKQVSRFLEKRQLKAIPLQQFYAQPIERKENQSLYRQSAGPSPKVSQKKLKVKREKAYRESSAEETSEDES